MYFHANRSQSISAHKPRRAAALFLLLAISALPASLVPQRAQAAAEPQYIRSTLDQAQQLVDLGQAEQAMGVLDQIGSAGGSYYRVHLVRAQALILLGRYDTAYDETLRAGVLEPGDPRVLHLQGVSLFYLKRSNEALPLLDRAIEMDPNFSQAYEYRGLIYRDLGLTAQAEADFQRARSAGAAPRLAAAAPPGRSVLNAPAMPSLPSIEKSSGGMTLSRSGGPARVMGSGPAVIDDQSVARQTPPQSAPPSTDNSRATPGPGQSYHADVARLYNSGDYSGAAALTRRQLEQFPGDPMLLFNMAALLQADGRMDDALEYYESAAEADPENTDVLVAWGAALEQAGDAEAGIDKYIEAIQRNPMNGPAHMNLGNAYIDLGEYELAAEAFQKALELDDDYMIFYYGLLTAFVGLDDMESAARLMQDIFGAQPIDVTTLPETNFVDYSLVSLVNADPTGNYNFARMLAEYGYTSDAATFYHLFVQKYAGRFPEAEANARAFLAKHPAPTGQ